MTKTSQSAKGIVKKCSPDNYQRFRHQWNGWNFENEPTMVFYNCAAEFCDKANQSQKSDRKFEDVPDFFRNRALTDSYFMMMGKCAEVTIEAAARLHCIATLAVQYLNEAASNAPQNFQPIAETDITWPGYLSDHPDAEKSQKKSLFPKLHLGEKSGIRMKGQKVFSLDTIETRIAIELWGHISFARRDKSMPTANLTPFGKISNDAKKLPMLTRETFRRWWKVGEKMFLNGYGKEFEKHERFAGYWHPNHPAYKGETNRRALIRRDIKKKVQQSFRSIAVKSSAV
jgi:hypothetical protein